MLVPDQVIKTFRFTEKSNKLTSDLNQYTFEIYPGVNRTEVAHAIETMFSVKVTRVNIINKAGKIKRSRTHRGKAGRTAHIKKAIVTLKQGDKIELA